MTEWKQRELEFRGWRVDYGQWFLNKDKTIHYKLNDFPRDTVPVIITQYTGVKDIKKKKIFEKD